MEQAGGVLYMTVFCVFIWPPSAAIRKTRTRFHYFVFMRKISRGERLQLGDPLPLPYKVERAEPIKEPPTRISSKIRRNSNTGPSPYTSPIIHTRASSGSHPHEPIPLPRIRHTTLDTVIARLEQREPVDDYLAAKIDRLTELWSQRTEKSDYDYTSSENGSERDYPSESASQEDVHVPRLDPQDGFQSIRVHETKSNDGESDDTRVFELLKHSRERRYRYAIPVAVAVVLAMLVSSFMVSELTYSYCYYLC